MRPCLVVHEDDQRFLTQTKSLQLGDQLAENIVHLSNIVGVVVFTVLGTVGSRQGLDVNVREAIVEREWFVAAFLDEPDGVVVHSIRFSR